MNNVTSPDIQSATSRYLSRCGLERTHIRAALIDMDGTLYDSMNNHATAWHQMVSELGFVSNRDEYFLFEGMTGAATINVLFKRFLGREATPDEIERLYRRKTDLFSSMPPVLPMPGAAAMLERLAALGIERILVTGSGQMSLIDRLNADFPHHFLADKMVTSRNVSRGKPSPEPYLKGMELAGVRPFEAMVVENAPLGVMAGARSGAFTVALTTGPIPPQALADAGADIIYPSMQAFADNVVAIVDALNKMPG